MKLLPRSRMSSTSSISVTRLVRSAAESARSCFSGSSMFSATESVGYMTGYWNTIPMLRAWVGSAVTSRSPNSTLPEVGVSRPAIMRINVVLPQPEGPSRHATSPSAKRMSMSLTAVKVPNCFVTRSMMISAMDQTLSLCPSLAIEELDVCRVDRERRRRSRRPAPLRP